MAFEDVAVVALESSQRCDVADDNEIVTVKKETSQRGEAPGHKPVVVADGFSKRLDWCRGVPDATLAVISRILGELLFQVVFLSMRRRTASLFVR